MKTILIAAAAVLTATMAKAGAFDELSSSLGRGPDAPAVEMPAAAPAKMFIDACPSNMKGDRTLPCVTTTPKTTVCADGKHINTARVTEKDVKAGKYGREELGLYKDPDLRAWAEYQRKLGRDPRWGDSAHQDMLATGIVNPLRTAYVVLPNRSWLGRAVTVCVEATGVCTEAQALEVGPATTFRDHSELSVRTLMNLGLDANPENGTYEGRVTFTFH